MSIFIDGVRVEEESAEGEETSAEPTEERLRATAARVSLELGRAELLSRSATAGGDLPAEIRTASGEACILRILRLRDFFYGEGGDPDHPVAADYLPEPEEWRRIRPARTALLDDWLDDLRAWVEPTLDPEAERRVPERSWPLVGFVAAVQVALEALLDGLPPERAGWFARRSHT